MRYVFSFLLACAFVAGALALRGLPISPTDSFMAYLVGGLLGGLIGLAFALDELRAAWIVALVFVALGALLAYLGQPFAWVMWPGLGLLAAALVATFAGTQKPASPMREAGGH